MKVEGYSNLGSTYMYLSDYYSAIEAYRRGLDVSSDNLVVLVNLGNAYRKVGQLQDAIDVFEVVVSKNTDIGMFYKTLAELYSKTGEHQKSLEYVRKAREFDEQDSSMILLENELLKSR
jgi:tetratricopeptide (TPR) repeat protein